MIQAPKSVGAGTEAVARFTRRSPSRAGAEIVLQNAPAPRGSDLKPETILEIVRGNPAIRYIKEETLPSGPAITAILADKPAHLKGVIGGGGARYIIDEYRARRLRRDAGGRDHRRACRAGPRLSRRRHRPRARRSTCERCRCW